MNVRDFVLNQLVKEPQTTEELSALLPLDKASRLGKTLATLEAQDRIKKYGDVWVLC